MTRMRLNLAAGARKSEADGGAGATARKREGERALRREDGRREQQGRREEKGVLGAKQVQERVIFSLLILARLRCCSRYFINESCWPKDCLKAGPGRLWTCNEVCRGARCRSADEVGRRGEESREASRRAEIAITRTEARLSLAAAALLACARAPDRCWDRLSCVLCCGSRTHRTRSRTRTRTAPGPSDLAARCLSPTPLHHLP